MSATLPTVGGDVDTWGSELNTFLATGHAADGSTVLAPYTAAGLPSTPANYQLAFVTDGAIRGPHIWIPGQGWKDLMNGVANASFFGAKFDGTTNDTAALQEGLDALGEVTVAGLKLQDASGNFQAGAAAPGAGVLELPHGSSWITTLTAQHRPIIRGKGKGTYLRQIASTTGPMIKNRRDGTRHAGYVEIENMQLDGNKANQTVANHVVYIVGDTTNTYNSPLDEDYDVRCRLTNVYIRNAKGSGVYMEGAGGNWLRGVFTRNCDQYGIYAFQDNNLDHCETAWSGLAGLMIAGDSCRISNHKSWFNGQITASLGHGYHITADSGVTGVLAAQDNKGAGVLFENAYSWSVAAFEGDDNDTSAGDYPAIDLWNSQHINIMPAHARNRYNGASTPGRQNITIRHRGGSDYNEFRTQGSRGVWGVTVALTSDSTVNNSKIFVNGVERLPGATV